MRPVRLHAQSIVAVGSAFEPVNASQMTPKQMAPDTGLLPLPGQMTVSEAIDKGKRWAHPGHICTVTRLSPATSPPGLAPPQPPAPCTGAGLPVGNPHAE